MEDSPKGSLVVSQGGARPAPEVLSCLEGSIVTVTHEETEPMADLTQRVRRAVEYLAAKTRGVHQAVFVARPGFDLPDVPATAELVRHVVSHMVGQGHGAVHLQASEGDARSRYALIALADAVSDQVRGTGVKVVTSIPQGSQTLLVASKVKRAASA